MSGDRPGGVYVTSGVRGGGLGGVVYQLRQFHRGHLRYDKYLSCFGERVGGEFRAGTPRRACHLFVVFERVSMLLRFLRSEDGSDLVEYSLLLAFICLASAATVVGAGVITKGLWSITNSRLASAAVSSS